MPLTVLFFGQSNNFSINSFQMSRIAITSGLVIVAQGSWLRMQKQEAKLETIKEDSNLLNILAKELNSRTIFRGDTFC